MSLDHTTENDIVEIQRVTVHGCEVTDLQMGAQLGRSHHRTHRRAVGLHEGSTVEMFSRSYQVILRKKTYYLADMLATVTDENLHRQVDTGPAQVREAW